MQSKEVKKDADNLALTERLSKESYVGLVMFQEPVMIVC